MFIKFVAFYLPQYHSIPENDRWWGKGFTEWIRVKNAKPLFKDHYQPRIPYKYYDLSDVNEMKDQAMLAQEYGIFGFCYYHYWFNGKLLLEKPLEQMLNNKEVDIPFCLAWANEPWTRAWDGRSKEILVEQKYGIQKDWGIHLEYLVNFFSDERYIKINGHPVFLIYRTESYRGFDEMISFWNTKLALLGMANLYIVEMLTSFQKSPKCVLSRGVVEFEPMFTIGKGHTILKLLQNYFRKKFSFLYSKSYKTFSYDKVWGTIVSRNNKYPKKILFHGAFTDWDNTPRFKDKSTIFKNTDPLKFEKYLRRQIAKSNSEYIFINAWNEWAEGAYLEPDQKNGFAFLGSIKRITDDLAKQK